MELIENVVTEYYSYNDDGECSIFKVRSFNSAEIEYGVEGTSLWHIVELGNGISIVVLTSDILGNGIERFTSWHPNTTMCFFNGLFISNDPETSFVMNRMYAPKKDVEMPGTYGPTGFLMYVKRNFKTNIVQI